MQVENLTLALAELNHRPTRIGALLRQEMSVGFLDQAGSEVLASSGSFR
jgi:hypothetical protein